MKPTPHSDKDIINDRLAQLAQTRRQLSRMPPEKAMDAILDHPQSLALVHSIPEQDLLALIHEAGADDSLELLALTSDRQREYILDIETWRKDRLSTHAVTRWVGRFLEASPDHTVSWLLRKESDLTAFYLSQTLEIRIREHDQEPSEMGQDFVTLDNVYYVRLKPAFTTGTETDADPDGTPSVTLDKPEMELRESLIKNLLNRIAAFDHRQFQALLLESASLMSAEQEENLYHWRSVRLAEKGFVPFDEALGVYQKLDADRIQPLGIPKSVNREAERQLPVPLVYDQRLTGKDRFQKTLHRLQDPDLVAHLQIEFTTLANHVAAADQAVICTREDLEKIADKVSGYLSIGLERLADTAPVASANALREYALADIFRVGYGLALGLKWQAQAWIEEAWFRQAGFPLTFWDETWTGILGGLLIKKPLFFDNYESSGALYREFKSLVEIQDTEVALKQITALDQVLSRLKIDWGQSLSAAAKRLSFKTHLLTIWARVHQGLPMIPAAIPVSAFKAFFDFLFGGAKEKRGRVPHAAKQAFADWLSEATDLSQDQIARRTGHTLDALFAEIEAELGQVARAHIDSRFIRLFWLERTIPDNH